MRFNPGDQLRIVTVELPAPISKEVSHIVAASEVTLLVAFILMRSGVGGLPDGEKMFDACRDGPGTMPLIATICNKFAIQLLLIFY